MHTAVRARPAPAPARSTCRPGRRCTLKPRTDHWYADGGSSTLENGIALCLDCHSQAGHYNARHPIGNKYSPEELRRHRDLWWEYCRDYDSKTRPPGYNEPVTSARDPVMQEKRVGTLWSHRADISEETELIRFRGILRAKDRHETVQRVRWRELYVLRAGGLVVYEEINHRGDYGTGELFGSTQPLSLDEIQTRFPELASQAGLERIRDLDDA